MLARRGQFRLAIALIQSPRVQAVLSSASVAFLAMRCSMHLASMLVQKYVVAAGMAGISDSAEALEGGIARTRIKVGLEFREQLSGYGGNITYANRWQQHLGGTGI